MDLVRLKGYSYEEATRRMGISQSTVDNHLQKAASIWWERRRPEQADRAVGTLRVWLALAGLLSIGGLAPAELDAQYLSGRVLDDATGESVAGAAVRLEDGDRIVAHMITDPSGEFGVSPPAGTFGLRVDRLGYQSIVHPGLRLEGTDTLHLDLRIGTDAIPLEPLTVVARGAIDARLARWGFYDRQEWYKHRSAEFLTRAEIEAKIPGRATDLFHHLPRVRVAGGGRVQEVRIRRFGRYCKATLYLDGHRLPLAHDEGIDDFVPVGAIVAVEVYTAEAAPAQYVPRGEGPCGSVVIWTGVVR